MGGSLIGCCFTVVSVRCDKGKDEDFCCKERERRAKAGNII